MNFETENNAVLSAMVKTFMDSPLLVGLFSAFLRHLFLRWFAAALRLRRYGSSGGGGCKTIALPYLVGWGHITAG